MEVEQTVKNRRIEKVVVKARRLVAHYSESQLDSGFYDLSLEERTSLGQFLREALSADKWAPYEKKGDRVSARNFGPVRITVERISKDSFSNRWLD